MPQISSARVLDIDTFGLSIHLDKSNENAPLRLDSKAVYVFNPGVGLGYDFRKTAMTPGFSLIIKAGFFWDCMLVPNYYTTAGVRYATIFADDYSIGASVSGGLRNSEECSRSEKTRKFSFMPLPVFEIGRRIYNNDALKLGVVYAPGDLLFMMLSFEHSL